MAEVKPFKGLIANSKHAKKIASPPYDVITKEDAKALVAKNACSFVKVIRSDVFAKKNVYEAARENLAHLVEQGYLEKRSEEAYYIYRQSRGENMQTGIVATVSINDYANNVIKKHEQTRTEREIDRTNHFAVVNANTEAVFLAYRERENINARVDKITFEEKPFISFVAEDGVLNELWEVRDFAELEKDFSKINSLYIADGHHRAISAYKVCAKRRQENPGYTGEEEFNYFMAVLFPSSELEIMGYNRVVYEDLDIEKLRSNFDIEEPSELKGEHEILVYARRRWHKIRPKERIFSGKKLPETLDVKILQEYLFEPHFGISDPRTDERLDFVGGSRGFKYLEELAGDGTAFALYPVNIFDLFEVSDNGFIMPPKSTWFEPKLMSGLFVHEL